MASYSFWQLFLQVLRIAFCTAVPSVLALNAQAQQPVTDVLQAALMKYQSAAMQEKVFLHTDKDFYLTGETIWFKAYVTGASTHKPSELSKVLHVDLVNSEGNAVVQATINLQHGLGDGYLELSSSLLSTTYRLRAYTAWMQNFDPAFVFQQPVQVVNAAYRPNWAALEKRPAVTVKFFPEGGNLVAGIETKVGFQVLNQYGEGVAGVGAILNTTGDTIVRFRPQHAGTGSFLFTAQKGGLYKAIVRLNTGQVLTASLPQVYENGHVLQVTEKDGEMHILATHTNSFDEPLYLLGHTRGEVHFAARQITKNRQTEWVVSKSLFGDGISCFTLFSDKQQPLCERLFFKRPLQLINVDVRSSVGEIGVRSKVSVQLMAKGSNGQPVEGDFSMSVFRLDSLQEVNSQSIETYMWLTSDLRGHIESPAYYFEKDDAEHNTALDNLLLTQGWRRFKWEDVLSGPPESFPHLPEYEGPLVQFAIRNKQTGQPANGVLCYLSVPGEWPSVSNAISNANGELNFAVREVYGPSELVVQANGMDSLLSFERLSQSFPSVPDTLAFILPEKWKAQLAQRHLDVQLITAPTSSTSVPFTAIDTLQFFGKPDKRYVLDEYTRFPEMETLLREVITEVRVLKRSNALALSLLNAPYNSRFDVNPLVLVDGLPVFAVEKLLALDPLKVKNIDVVARKFFWGNTVCSGILSLSTYEADLGELSLPTSVSLLSYNGLQVRKEYYAPDYTLADRRQSREPDRRNVLLWQSSIKTGADGKATTSFWTSNLKGRFAICVQGLSADGQAGSNVVMMDIR